MEQKIRGNYIRKSGKTGFILAAMGDFYLCTGIAPELQKNTPVVVTGNITDKTDKTIGAVKVEIDCSSRTFFVRKCSAKLFEGCGKVTAGKIYDRLKRIDSEFGNIPKEKAEEIINYFGLPELTVTRIMEFIYTLSDIMCIYEYISEKGGNYQDAEKLYDMYHTRNIENAMSENPYHGISHGLTFKFCDNMAWHYEIDELDDIRLEALAKKISQEIISDGSTCTDKNTLSAIIKRIQRGLKYEPVDTDFMLLYLASSEWFECFEEKGTIYIQHKKQYQKEVRITEEMARLVNTWDERIEEDSDYSMKLDDEQKTAVRVSLEHAISVVTGGPGTGKTTVIKEIIERYLKAYPKNKCFLCAPSGRAASRITESTGFEATTVHKLLGFLPYKTETGENMITYNAQNRLPQGIFVVDEASMIDEQLFLYLLEAIPNGSCLILTGDPKQLPSVQPGNVLYDIIESGVVPCTQLKTIHRQTGNESNIVKNYYKIVEKDASLSEGSDFKITRADTYNEALRQLSEACKKIDTKDPYDMQILCFMAKHDIGKTRINSLISSSRQKAGNRRFGRSSYCVGDKVMMTSNNYAENYWNGNIGVIKGFTDNGLIVSFYDGINEIKRSCFEDMDHAWACTVHKAQGSEFDSIIIMIDDAVDIMLYNNLILTAITRAKSFVHIISVNDALEKSIKNDSPERKTGLSRLLISSLEKTSE